MLVCGETLAGHSCGIQRDDARKAAPPMNTRDPSIGDVITPCIMKSKESAATTTATKSRRRAKVVHEREGGAELEVMVGRCFESQLERAYDILRQSDATDTAALRQ